MSPLVGDLGDAVVREAALEVLLQSRLQPGGADEWLFSALVAHDTTNFLFNGWWDAH
jgi:hypothetical protein